MFEFLESMLRMKHPYQDFITQVEKPGRYLGGEYQSIVKDWAETPVRIGLSFPDLYEIGMSHMGMKILYSILNKEPDILAERAYTPWFDMEKELRDRQLPIYSMENVKPLNAFDILGFSLQYEMTFTNVLTMLDLSGIPILAADRDTRQPLIIAGGPCAMNPEPMSRFIDAFVIGDGEEIFIKLARTYVALRDAGKSKTEILIALSQLGGIYCPALYATREEEFTGLTVVDQPLYEGVPALVKRNIIENINDYPYPDDSPVPLTEAVFDRTTMEIARGCTEGCRFCQAGIIYRPVRERDPDQIISSVLSSIEKAGYDESSLTSLSTADFSCVSPLVKNLMEKLKQKRVSLSVSSLRAYGLTGDLLDEIADVRNTSLTFAPEAGTQRMRDVINKNITEEDIAQSAHNIFARGWRKMKLYFMIGLPTEMDEDVVGIADTAARMLDIAKKYYKNWKMVNVTASISSFVPKPHTPFQWCQMMDLPEIQRKQGLLMGLARKYQIGLKWHESLISHIEGIIARGDRKVGAVIEGAWRKGARLDGWGNFLKFDDWMAAIEEAGIDKYTYLRTLPLDSQLPWGHIHVGVEPKFIIQEYKRALKDRLSPPCGKPFTAKVHSTNLADHEADQRKLICYSCGIACDMKQMRDERGEYLVKLGALEKREVLETPEVGQVRAPKLEKFEQSEPFTYRALYTKLKRAQFVSHSDLIRSLPRIIRRANLEAYYSQGYHPKPVMVFAPALSLGVPSFGEYLDFQLVEDLPVNQVLERLNAVCPEGIQFLSIEKVENNNKDLAKRINGATYLVGIQKSTLMGLMQVREDHLLETLAKRIQAILESEHLWVTRKRRDRVREVDIRPLLGKIEIMDSEDLASMLSQLDWETDQLFLRMEMQIAGTDSLKPEEILKSLFGHDDFYYATARLSLQPFQAELQLETVEV
ncbi:B12-binding domain-containing radical SAM protein [bacterium (Candidatus Blackallbacteria) CG17_big_fil_post_rev_8_21_14_2_50_48_46]|uniref:B12-binding domain-containing radical SAM protein n=1 Tax=bacterium (Candidatus Blackallbacteria) CG17_big_fil_post_rev_8_21_14_2_50_48_46 TaxID=2014261 RepID=A0A2M7FYS3_9BACT|nr:MAG: B12-binding domain-containing radical SAM protein [bacterium (Candidatus Blackallbacteria) CG18_big_fil_WC_8_21_14_2_50_49_26]PIW14207.1 MAG: B12-binding domain-containing radical SAM protein [bacterium (Candidatus Blackallbacteria) CG17_big_fil_post_rev_8_21_14_2_50_48_46]